MSTVINQPYRTAGNGGRKLVRLQNGDLFAILFDNASVLKLYKSVDNGLTWSFSKDIASGVPISGWSMVTNGTTLFIVYFNSSSGKVTCLRVNTATLDVLSSQVNENGTTVTGEVSVAIDPINGNLHAAWSSKNTARPNSFNIRYAKSLDGGFTWTAVTQVTSQNTSGHNLENPSIVVLNDAPIITFSAKEGANRIYASVWNGTQFVISTVYYGDVYLQSNPSAVVDKNGVIHVVWKQSNSTSSTTDQIAYAKSTDGGLTWSIAQQLTKSLSGTANYNSVNYPSLTVDKTDKLIVVFFCNIYNNQQLYQMHTVGGEWTREVKLTSGYHSTYPSVLLDNNIIVGNTPPTVYEKAGANGGLTSVEYIGSYTTNNEPTLSLTSPTNNLTLYENDTLNIAGTAHDADPDQSVTAYYQINNEQRKVLATNLSQTQIGLSKQLTFKGGKLYDGETAITGDLADGVAHTLKVWAEDSEKASSAIIERTFYVVPNRAPLLSVDAVVPSGVVDTDKFKISGNASDQDANANVTVTQRINGGNAIEIYNGPGGAWEFDVSLAQLTVGENTIIIEVIDNYGAKSSKTIKLNKNEVKTPILQSVARYKIEPPKGSAKGVLLFLERDVDLDLKVELSMTLVGEQENYVTLTQENTAPMPNQTGIVEDTYYHEANEPKNNIILKLSTTRPDVNINHKIHLISGVVD